MRRWLTLGAVSVALTACGGNDDSNTTTTSSTPPAASTTPSTSTSTSTTSTTSTTIAPTSTVPLIDEIQAAMDDFLADYLRCGEAPASCDVSFLADGSTVQTAVRQRAMDRAGADQYYAPDNGISYIQVESITSRSATQVSAITCWFDAIVVLGPPGPDGSATIVNDQQLSVRTEYVLSFEQARWKVADGTEIETLGDGNLCDG